MKAALPIEPTSALNSREMMHLKASAGETSSDKALGSAEILDHLSSDLHRIATRIAKLSSTGPAPNPSVQTQPSDLPSAKLVQEIIRDRRTRSQFFSPNLFADPAWDMLLDLYHAELSYIRVSVSSLCIASDVPQTTALRWINLLVGQGLVLRRADPHDGRRIFIELTAEASESMRNYFHEIRHRNVI